MSKCRPPRGIKKSDSKNVIAHGLGGAGGWRVVRANGTATKPWVRSDHWLNSARRAADKSPVRVFYSLYGGIRIAFAGAENGDTGGFSNGVCDLWNIPVVIGGWRECVGTVRIEGQGADTCDSCGLACCIDGRVTGDAG